MTPAPFGKPDPSEYGAYYGKYIGLIHEEDILHSLGLEADGLLAYLRPLSDTAGEKRYANDKWSIKEVVGHVIDCERVFGYRALYIARQDPASLPGFEQDDWAQVAGYGGRRLSDLTAEFDIVRQSHLHFFRHLTREAWLRRGVANNVEFTVRALAYLMAGHERHHLQVLKTRYL